MSTDVSSYVDESDDLSPSARLFQRLSGSAVRVEDPSPPSPAFGHARQSRLTTELLGALGTTAGSIRPRYRRGMPSVPVL